MKRGHIDGRTDAIELVALLVDAVLLAVFEVFFLLLRADGTVLPNWGAAPVPVSALAAALTTSLLVARAGRIAARTSVAGAPLLAWLLVVIALGLAGGPGGDVVLLPDWRTLLLIGCGAIPGALTLGKVLGKAATIAGDKPATSSRARKSSRTKESRAKQPSPKPLPKPTPSPVAKSKPKERSG